MKNTIKDLQQLGLNNNQAKTYLTILKLGKCTASEISKESSVARTTVYDNVRVLKQYDLIEEGYEKGKKHFTAQTPANLKNIIDQKADLITTLVDNLGEIYKSSTKRPKITIQKGPKAFKKMHELSLIHNRKRRTRLIGSVNNIFSWVTRKYIKKYVKSRIEKGIKNQVITNQKVLKMKDMYSQKKNKESLREIKYLENIGSIKTGLFNFDDFVCISPPSDEGFVIIIQSKDFAKTFNSLFEFLWKYAKEVQ